MKHKAFTLIEIFIAVTIIFIMAGMVALNVNVWKQTAKQEAQRIATFIHQQMRKAERTHDKFSIYFDEKNQFVSYFDILVPYHGVGTEIITIDSKDYLKTTFELNSSCKISSPQEKIDYISHSNTFKNINEQINLTIKDSFNNEYQVIIKEFGMVTTKKP